jgi:aconitate hydratase
MAPGRALKVILHHEDGSSDAFDVAHTYNEQQIEWVRAGSALNKIRQEMGVA